MRTADERIKELHRRMTALEGARARRRRVLTGGLAWAGCLTAAVLLALGVSRVPVRAQDALAGSAAGSVFAGSPALGYIVVALAALALGSLATVFCFRLQRRAQGGSLPHPPEEEDGGEAARQSQTEVKRDDRAD